MTPQEFKAWFDGFTEALDGTPNKEQWKRIKDRVAEIDGAPITERVYVDRYWPSYPRYPLWTYTACSSGVTGSTNIENLSFNSVTAMHNLGQAEAANMVANGGT